MRSFSFRKLIMFMNILALLASSNVECVKAADPPALQLNACAACLIDSSNNRLLYGKNENDVRAMASTTKIMTLIVALENGNLDDIVTISEKAARQPDVQLNVKSGEQYYLKDLLYAMMLESYNDVAYAVAEHVGGGVELFVEKMNQKAFELGCFNTHFVTPNGLDGEDEGGKHATTAYELACISSYAINNSMFCEIVKTRDYTFGEIQGKRSCSAHNRDSFLNMMDGAVGIKTGFTGEAGYCFVGALEKGDYHLISVVLGSGWPPQKTLKWKDTRTLMNYGLQNYEYSVVYQEQYVGTIKIMQGNVNNVEVFGTGDLQMLLASWDQVHVVYDICSWKKAPVPAGTEVGGIDIIVNGVLQERLPVKTIEGAEKQKRKFFPKLGK